jgi:peptide/nickel transport system permease protein
MIRHLLNRLLIALPVLFVVSIVAFFLALSAPGDIVEDLIATEHEMASIDGNYVRWHREYERVVNRIGRDKPLFYFAVLPSSMPDTLHRIIIKSERETAETLARRTGNWPAVDHYMASLRHIVTGYDNARFDTVPGARSVCNDLRFLLITIDPGRSSFLWQSIDEQLPLADSQMSAAVTEAEEAYKAVLAGRHSATSLIPKIVWHGRDNQYHHWISDILTGDFGVSIIDGRPVAHKIKEAARWTLRINLTAIFLAFAISIPLGLATARRAGSRFDKYINYTLFTFFAVPSFWLATLLIVFFTTPEYADWLDLFPTGGIGNYHYESGFRRIGILIASLFLPVLSLTLGALAYLTRQMRGSVIKESRKDYVRMARAKGLTEREVYRKHIFRNALFPILTLVGAAIPASVSGSVIIEVLFSIPGMGRLLYESVLSQDWMVVFAMVLLASVLTVVGYLISDLLYRLTDPRLRTQRKLS